MEEQQRPGGRARGLVAALMAAAAVAVAVPVAGALAAGDSTTSGGDSRGTGNVPVQTQERDGNCPEKDGAGGGGSTSSDAPVQL